MLVKLVHGLGVSEEPQFKVCFTLCQLAPSSAFNFVQSTPDNTRLLALSCSQKNFLVATHAFNAWDCLHFLWFVSARARSSQFLFGRGAYHHEWNLAVRATLSLTMRTTDVLLLSSWKKVTISLFYSCFRIRGNGSILLPAFCESYLESGEFTSFCESHLEWLSWGLSRTKTNPNHSTIF